MKPRNPPGTPPPMNLSQEFTKRLTASQSALYARIAALMGTTEEANDVLQNTNVALCQKSADYDFERPFLAWAFTFARFEVMAWRNVHKRSRLLLDDELVGQLAEDMASNDSWDECRLTALEQCLERLPVDHRKLMSERYEFNRSVQSMAARMAMSDNSVAALLYRIRKTLQACVQLRMTRGDA